MRKGPTKRRGARAGGAGAASVQEVLQPHLVLQSNLHETAGAAARVGRTLRGRWHLDTLIDVGGMAAVYAATHPNGTRGAVKILHAHASPTPEVACTFLREGHPNAVRVFDDDVDDDGHVCVVMELLEGGTLHECAHAAGGKLGPDQVLRLIDQLLDGLAALHDAGIVHRDIKPANLFLTTEGRVKILDFGIASICDSTANWSAATIAWTVIGTPEFMSPEQARGRLELVDAQSDLWSVGATAFTLLSGEHVHSGASLPELLAAIFARPARSLASALPEAHPALVEVVDRALERRRADRWADARAMQGAVRAAYLAIYGKPLPVAEAVVIASALSRAPEASLSLDGAGRVTAPTTSARRPPARRGAWVVPGAVVLASLCSGLAVSAPTGHARAQGLAPPLAASAASRVDVPFTAAPASTATLPPPARPTLHPDPIDAAHFASLRSVPL